MVANFFLLHWRIVTSSFLCVVCVLRIMQNKLYNIIENDTKTEKRRKELEKLKCPAIENKFSPINPFFIQQKVFLIDIYRQMRNMI